MDQKNVPFFAKKVEKTEIVVKTGVKAGERAAKEAAVKGS
jgi:hypothetical protein